VYFFNEANSLILIRGSESIMKFTLARKKFKVNRR
jgi:hypothetical protein